MAQGDGGTHGIISYDGEVSRGYRNIGNCTKSFFPPTGG